MGTKYLLNALDVSVRDNLAGLAWTNPNVQLAEHVDGIVRKDFLTVRDKGRVMLISGGGAGHEPMFAGFVGPKLLTAAVSGSYFASPPAGQIIRLVEQISQPKTPILLVVANYTGDRLSFGLAKEYLTMKGYRDVRLFVFGDDCAPFLTDTPKEDVERRRRGLAGIAFIHRIAGLLSDQGATIDELEARLKQLSRVIYTISISLSACDIPGHGASFSLDAQSMELALGVHGESGIQRVPLMSANKTIDLIATKLVECLEKQGHMQKSGSNRVALLVNNLGGLTMIEENLVLKEVVELLRHKNFDIVRMWHGCIMTSFNMKGVSLSVLLLDDDLYDEDALLKLLDQTETGFVHGGLLNTDPIFHMPPQKGVEADDSVRVAHYCEPDLYRAIMSNINHEHELNQLDETVGDSDAGSTLRAIASVLQDQITKSPADQPPPFSVLGKAVFTAAGGTGGGIYAILLTSAANYVKMHRDQFERSLKLTSKERAQCWLGLLKHCMERVSTYGGARVKDRSMIDALHGMQIGLEKGLALDGSPGSLCRSLAESTWTHAKQTASMKARVGRAAYVNAALVTKPDAGAIGVAIWTQAVVDTVMKSLPPSKP